MQNSPYVTSVGVRKTNPVVAKINPSDTLYVVDEYLFSKTSLAETETLSFDTHQFDSYL